MNHFSQTHSIIFVFLFIQICFFNDVLAASPEGYDYSHRKRDCEITIVTSEGEPLAGVMVGINQLRNDFVFGGTMRSEAFDSLGYDYEEWILKYFDYGTPENEMNWETVMNCSEKCTSDFTKADTLVNWLLEKHLPIVGTNLFSNQNEDLLPEWTHNLDATTFKQAMLERITSEMEHFKEKTVYWNLIDKICHGTDGSISTSGILETKSGDPDIFNWILDESRTTDPFSSFVISDYGLITSSDQTAADCYINKVKPINNKFDIIGAESHFNENLDKSIYESNINYLAQELEKPIWLTDVDFTFDSSQAPDKIEELMRTCFANPNVGGLIMGNWCKQFISGTNYTNYFIDSLKKETPVGERWCKVRDEWRTIKTGYADESGKFSFNGFQGKYKILISCYTDTFYLEPGEGTKTIEVAFNSESAIQNRSPGLKTTKISINGVTIPLKLPPYYTRDIFVTTYSLSGQEITRLPLNVTDNKYQLHDFFSSCRLFVIETADRRPLYKGKIMSVR